MLKLHLYISVLLCFVLSLFTTNAEAQELKPGLAATLSRIYEDPRYGRSMGLQEAALLQEFYVKVDCGMQWFATKSDSVKRNVLRSLVSDAGRYMLDKEDYLSRLPQGKGFIDTIQAELKYTDVALSFLRDMAYPAVEMVKYNGWQYKPDCIAVASLLQQAISSGNFARAISEAEPESNSYKIIREAYQYLYNLSLESNFKEIKPGDKTVSTNNKNLVDKLRQLGYLGRDDTSKAALLKGLSALQVAHNLPVQPVINAASFKVLNESIAEKLDELKWNVRWYRWLSCMQNRSYVLVNIATNRLALMGANKELLSSKIVVGKISTPSPTLTSAITTVVYYPYWNVPFSIATKEMLPRLKKNPAYLDQQNIKVLQGNHVYHSSREINWSKYSGRNFPFNFRQETGCDNALGLLKFDFENPFHVYLHDTNNKSVFSSGKRFFSHGCIRVEKPYELALALGVPATRINMDSCLTGMKPTPIKLEKAIPVFIIYSTIDIIGGELRWYEDAYHKRPHVN